MVKENMMEFVGVVEEALKDKFVVKVSDSYKVMCTLSGKIRQAGIKIVPNDSVQIEVSAYDTTRGRITYRLK